jgi:pimeloyl-ACP methyl ester carboxylesterase
MAFAKNAELSIYFETFGNIADPTLVLINGLGNQCIAYRSDFCELFVEAGFHVVRFDNRDVGLSSDGPEGYSLKDMASDAVAVLDDLAVKKAHVFGVSLGGMIAQTFAIEFPDRCASLISVMSTTGDSDVGRPTDEARELLLTPGSTRRDLAIELHLAGKRVWGSPGHIDEASERTFAGEVFDRACRPMGVGRQFKASRADRSRTERLRELDVPTLVIHGDCDTLIDISGGIRTAEVIPHARFLEIEGMGHDYPDYFWTNLVSAVREHCQNI